MYLGEPTIYSHPKYAYWGRHHLIYAMQGVGPLGLLFLQFYLHDCPIFILRACLTIQGIVYYRMSCNFIYRDLVQKTLPALNVLYYEWRPSTGNIEKKLRAQALRSDCMHLNLGSATYLTLMSFWFH